MPGGDRTGPNGKGPRTGRGLGYTPSGKKVTPPPSAANRGAGRLRRGRRGTTTNK